MGIALACPSCGARMEYQDADAGRTGQCPTCKGEIQIPLRTKVCVACRRHVATELVTCPACGSALALGASTSPMPIAPVMPPVGPLADAPTSGKAVTSLVLGLISFIFFCLTGIPAIIVGVLALTDIRRAAGRMTGAGMATTGIVTGTLSTLCVLPITLALLLPAVQMAREAARRAQCRNNLRQIGMALHEYHSAWKSFPPAYTVDAQGKPLLSWRVLILPYLDEQTLYDEFHLDEPWDSPHNMQVAATMPDTYSCPSDPMLTGTGTAYVAISGPGTAFPLDRSVSIREISDGAASTAMVGEIQGGHILWTMPEDMPFDAQFNGPGNFTSYHPGGWNMLMADGTVRFLSGAIGGPTCRALMTIAGGEQITGF